MKDFERFISKVEKTDDCWNWIGAKYRKGYGHFRMKIDGKWVMYKAHRYSYEYYNDKSAQGMIICHTCDNPSCVNPAHLFAGSNQDNVDDKLAKGRHKYGINPNHNHLNWDIVKRMRKTKKENPNLTYREIGKIYNTSAPQAHRICSNTTWVYPKED